MPPKRKCFVRVSAPAAAKKRREAKEQNHNEVQDATLLSLVDDCFLPIFDRLSTYDLCSVAQTCKRLHRVSGEHFLHRNKSKVLILKSVSIAGDLVTGPSSEKYMDLFATSCRNVTLGEQLAKQAVLKRFANFFKINQMTPIKYLRIAHWENGLTIDHGRIMAPMLTDVESFTLSDAMIYADLHDSILKYLPKMNRLTIVQSYQWMNFPFYRQWLQNPYPNLRYFAWHTSSSDFVELIDSVCAFLQINPGIRFFSLKTKSVYALQKFTNHNIRISELFFTVNFDNPSNFHYLQQLCVKQGTRLHLKFPEGKSRDTLVQFMTLFNHLPNYIDGLFFKKDPISNAIAHTLTKFPNLKVLQLYLWEDAEIIAGIPTLQEIYAYWGVDRGNFEMYRKNLMTFASRMPNLKRIYIRNNSQKFKKFQFDQMDAARRQLAGACKLKIFVQTDEPSATGDLNDIQREYETIVIERVETEEVTNPLVSDYLHNEYV